MRNIKEVIINGVTLEEILKKHEKWLNGEERGEKANLSYADLSYVDLTNANLSYADLNNANLKHCNFYDTNLSNSNLTYTDLRYANLVFSDLSDAGLNNSDLTYANLRYANLNNSDLFHANLSRANLSNAYLNGTDLRYANLNNVCLKYTNLKDITYNENTSFSAMQCPEEGSFIGYKKASYKIVKLLITEDAKRSNATSRKCRCSKAKVLSITNIDNTVEYNEVHSNYDYNFIYKVGEIVKVDNFDENRWNECSTGIHFFMTRDEAVKY